MPSLQNRSHPHGGMVHKKMWANCFDDDGDVSQLVGYWPGMQEALRSIPSTTSTSCGVAPPTLSQHPKGRGKRIWRSRASSSIQLVEASLGSKRPYLKQNKIIIKPIPPGHWTFPHPQCRVNPRKIASPSEHFY